MINFRSAYLKNVNQQLGKLGFDLDYADKAEGVFQWKKKLFEETFQYVHLSNTRSSTYKKSVSCDLGLISPYLVELFNKIKVSQCIDANLSIATNPNDDYEAINVFGVALHWLCLNAEKPLRQLDWPAMADNAEENVALLLQHIDTYWTPMLKMVDTEEKLIAFLNDIDNYPKKTYAKGPQSGDADVYSAFYSLKIGKVADAKERIEIAYDKLRARDQRLFGNDKETLAACNAMQDRIYAKYREEINRHG